jgi:hypothetical protein
MNMKRLIPLCLVLLGGAALAFAQDPGAPDPTKIGADSAQQLLKEVSVTRFEDAAFFAAAMPVDQGLVELRKFAGGPAEKAPIADEDAIGIAQSDDSVIGAKVSFFRRGPHQLVVAPVRPIPIEGISKMLSLWVVGRNYNHVLKILVTDYFGEHKELTLGTLNFMGWKRMSVAIPPNMVQNEFHYSGRSGIQFEGLKIEFDMMETYGQYYVYFDDLRAWTDLFNEVSRDSDSMSDDW